MTKLNMLSVQLLISRMLLSSIFLIGGFWKLNHHEALLASMMTHFVPVASILSYFSTYIELFCSLGILLGFKTKFFSYLVFLYMVIITWYYHMPMLQFDILSTSFNLLIKNIAIMGGLLSLAAIGSGNYSVDFLRKNSEHVFDVEKIV